jgi:hypothetical protein
VIDVARWLATSSLLFGCCCWVLGWYAGVSFESTVDSILLSSTADNSVLFFLAFAAVYV